LQEVIMNENTQNVGKQKLSHQQIPQFLETRLKKLHEKAKIEGVLTKGNTQEYLSKYVRSIEAMISSIEIGRQEQAIDEFKATTHEIAQHIFERGYLTAHEITGYQSDIEEKTVNISITSGEEQTEIVDDIGVTLTEASFQSDKRKEAREREAFFNKDLIPYGFDKDAKYISVNDFFSFPFGDYRGPNEADWFNFHLRYLEIAVKQKKLSKSDFVKISNLTKYIPKHRYKRYYNIFPNDKFEKITFMAVYNLWKNREFDNLKILL
ncbi:hypothetical protein KKA14_20745, partial [bacterium]|nr:hypothetical protein [bacterium]